MAKKNKSKSWLSKQLTKLTPQAEKLQGQPNTFSKNGEAVSWKEAVNTRRYPDVYRQFTPDKVASTIQEDNRITFFCQNGLALKIFLLSDSIIRFKYSHKGNFEKDFSYAIDPSFNNEDVPYIFEKKKHKFQIQTQRLIIEIDKARLKVAIKNVKGVLINEDADGYRATSTILKGVSEVRINKNAPQDESYFGLGDKSGPLNLRGQILENWNTDAFGYGNNSDPLYRSIPFYFGLNKGLGYGIFLDNTYRTFFDFDQKESGTMSFWAEGGEVDYYFIYGPQLLSVAEKYCELTGKPEIPPMWSLGFHQCRWSYFPDERVKEVANEFRERKIPCDAIYLDIDYMDGYRCFTWNKNYFPQPDKLVKQLAMEGFRTVVMIDPGIRIDPKYKVYQEGIENDYFCRRSNGEIMEGPVWPPECVFPDFTNPEVRKWWALLYKELYVENGISGFWNDMNEPAVFKVDSYTFPDDVLHHHDGLPTNHKKAHNIYGFNMARATTMGLKTLKPEKRPFLVTRATFSGGQRHAAVWTGDNIASWEHLYIANTQCQRLSISGFSFVGSDIGGFSKFPDGELMVRWLQLGIFHPFYRIHSMGNNDDGSAEIDADLIKKRDIENRRDQEPWSYGKKYTPLAKKAIEWRYQLLPYIYTTFRQYVEKGTPMIRSLVFFDQKDENNYHREEEFLFGDHLLIAPVSKPGLKKMKLYLPKGNWYNYFTGKYYEGMKTHKVKVKLDNIPVFALAGSIIPHFPVMQYTNEKPVEEMTLKVFYTSGEMQSQLYEDAGEGYDYTKGKYVLRTFVNKKMANNIYISQQQEGTFQSTCRHFSVQFFGLPKKVKEIHCDNHPVSFNKSGNYFSFQINSSFKELKINLD